MIKLQRCTARPTRAHCYIFSLSSKDGFSLRYFHAHGWILKGNVQLIALVPNWPTRTINILFSSPNTVPFLSERLADLVFPFINILRIPFSSSVRLFASFL